MRALVVYESMFGNTRHIAEAIAEGLRRSMPTETILSRDATAAGLEDVAVIVVGAPTHAWGLSRPRTRDAAAMDAIKHPDHLLDSEPQKDGVREWLHELRGSVSCFAAAFDTRMDKPRMLTGSASRNIQRALRHSGFATLAAPHSFIVTGMAGPLAPGEIERAQQWGEAMGRTTIDHAPATRTPATAGV